MLNTEKTGSHEIGISATTARFRDLLGMP
jgi:hypothetical protein